MFIVTRCINEYYQEGEYFVAAYKVKPTYEQLKKLLTRCDDEAIDYLLEDGGGRIRKEDEWWYLRQINSGKELTA